MYTILLHALGIIYLLIGIDYEYYTFRIIIIYIIFYLHRRNHLIWVIFYNYIFALQRWVINNLPSKTRYADSISEVPLRC